MPGIGIGLRVIIDGIPSHPELGGGKGKKESSKHREEQQKGQISTWKMVVFVQ